MKIYEYGKAMRIFFSILLCLFLTTQVCADDGFFDQGFVTGKKTSSSPPPEAPPADTREPQGVEVGNVLGEESGLKAYSLGLIVNAYDQKHFIKHLQTALRTAAHNDLTISNIIAVGFAPEGREAEAIPFFKRTPELFALNILGGKIYPVDTVPERFKVTSSPAWFINTSQGTIIVEGKEEIWEFFNARGEFVEKGFQPVKNLNGKSERSPANTKARTE